MSEVAKFVIAFVMGLVVSIVGYKFLGVPHFLGAPGDWGRTPYITVRLESPFAPVPQDPSGYGPAQCGATLKIANHYSRAVSLSFYLVRKGRVIATTPSQGSSGGYDPNNSYPGNGASQGDNGYSDNGYSDNGSSTSQYGDPSQSDDGQDGNNASDTPYGADIRPDESLPVAVRVAGAQDANQDGYGPDSGASCADLNRVGAVQLQLVGCSVEGVTDPADADCSRQMRIEF